MKKELVPKLRFTEFKDSGEWEDIKLEKLCEKITQGGTPDTTKINYWNGNIQWLTPAEMGKTENYFIYSTNRTITELGLKNCSSILLPINSIIISTRAPIGHLAINKSNMAINQGCKGLIINKENHYIFLYYILFKNKNELNDLGAGNTFKELSSSILKNFKIIIPLLQEQKKIADCLSSIDELIDLQTQKVESLKQHKRSLMQKLFPKEGKILPEWRFPEFRDSGEWEEVKIREVLEYERPEKHIVKNTEYKKYGIPVLTANKSFILGYTDELANIYEKIPVIIFDDFTTDKKYVNFPFKIKSSAIKI